MWLVACPSWTDGRCSSWTGSRYPLWTGSRGPLWIGNGCSLWTGSSGWDTWDGSMGHEMSITLKSRGNTPRQVNCWSWSQLATHNWYDLVLTRALISCVLCIPRICWFPGSGTCELGCWALRTWGRVLGWQDMGGVDESSGTREEWMWWWWNWGRRTATSLRAHDMWNGPLGWAASSTLGQLASLRHLRLTEMPKPLNLILYIIFWLYLAYVMPQKTRYMTCLSEKIRKNPKK